MDTTFTEILHKIVDAIPDEEMRFGGPPRQSPKSEANRAIDKLVQKKHKSYGGDTE